MTPVLHIGSTAGAPWLDMWDPKIVGRMEQVARDQILPLRHDPRIIGYFSDNELGWWNAALWKMTLEQPPSSGQRRRLIRLLRETYWDDWAKLERDFESDEASSWKQLERRGRLFLKPGGRGIYAMRAFLGLIADRYYQLMHDIIRKYDPQAWFLGDRYQSFYYPEVVRASSRHVDISSSNLNAAWNDGTFPRFQLDTLHALAGKPVLVSEFYLAATENRSGNRNTAGIYPVVKTQSERAIAARNTLVALTQLPYVVGADWFQYFDEPRHGREDGENFNFGLVDIHNAPYEEITSMFRTLRPDDLKTRHRRTRPDAGGGVPPAPDDPFGDFTPTHALKNWDRERGFVRPASENALADLYLCWSADALYLGLYAIDIVEAAYYRNISVPKSDRALWTVASGGRELARARIGAGREAIVSEPTIRVECLSGLDTSVRNIAVMRLPAQLLGREQFKAGDMVGLECTLSTHCQAYRIEWKGTFHLRE